MRLLLKIQLLALLSCLPLLANAVEMVRCTSPDGKSSTLQRGSCASPEDIQTSATAVTPLVERSANERRLMRCTSRDGSRVSITQGNCPSPDDYQQPLR